MTMSEFVDQLSLSGVLGGGSAVLLLLLTMIQIAPIKVNPWTWLARKIGRALNGDTLDRLDTLEQDVKEMKQKNEEREAKKSRSSILRFGDEIRRGTRHSKEHFDQILLDISFYEHYCDTHKDFENNIALMTIEKIKDTYRECIDKDSFL